MELVFYYILYYIILYYIIKYHGMAIALGIPIIIDLRSWNEFNLISQGGLSMSFCTAVPSFLLFIIENS